MRPVFLRGLRRHLVRYDLNAVELIGLAVVLLFAVLIGVVAFASAADVRACDPPAEHQVLVWSVSATGSSTCQYIDRQR